MSHNQHLNLLFDKGITLTIKREDLIHPEVSGNKWRKLKYNIAFAKAHQKESLITFGGAYSNHIAATAAAGKIAGLKTIGIIRGEELGHNLDQTLQQNDTLRMANANGMHFHFLNRSEYRLKNSAQFIADLQMKHPNAFIVPEGGTNDLAIQGCTEILTKEDHKFDFICCPVGTGGTISGIIESSLDHQVILGFPALKGDFLTEEIKKYTARKNWSLVKDYHFGGYAKVTEDLVQFMNTFYKENHIVLDPIYTGKMMYGIFEHIEKGYFPENSRILAVHTGGLQGIAGMNVQLKKKGLSQILSESC